jgi:hypothetical protein
VIIVCCQLEVCVMGWRSCTKCGVSEYDHKTLTEGRLDPLGLSNHFKKINGNKRKWNLKKISFMFLTINGG